MPLSTIFQLYHGGKFLLEEETGVLFQQFDDLFIFVSHEDH